MTEQASARPVAMSPSTATKRIAALTWGLVFSGIGSAFLVGAVVQGYFELDVEELSTWIEVISVVGVLLPGTLALAWTAGRRVRLSPLIRYGLALLSIASGYLLGSTLPGEEGTADDAAWLASGEGRLSLALLGLCLVAALIVSLRRYPRNEKAPSEPTLEEMLYGRKLTDQG